MHRRSFKVVLFFLASLFMLQPSLSIPQENPLEGESTSKQPEHIMQALYSRSWAVVVGVNQYPTGGRKFQTLQYAIADARAVAEKLQGLGFEVRTLFEDQATRHNIVRTLADDIGKKAGKNDRIVFYFAGHGETKQGRDGNYMGYILPANYDPDHHEATAISMGQLREISSEIRAKHMAYVLDSCFSGGIIMRHAAQPAVNNVTFQGLKILAESRSHVVLTAGSKDEMVVEDGGHGVFTRVLLKALSQKYNMPWSQKGYMTAMDLAEYVRQRVLESAPNQSPQFGYLDGEGDVLLALFKPIDVTAEERERVEKAVAEALKDYKRRQDERIGREMVSPVF